MRKGGTREASDIDDLRMTGDFIFNLSQPRVNKADQHYRQHTRVRINTNVHMFEGFLHNKDEDTETAWGTNHINEGKERAGDFKDYARKYGQSE